MNLFQEEKKHFSLQNFHSKKNRAGGSKTPKSKVSKAANILVMLRSPQKLVNGSLASSPLASSDAGLCRILGLHGSIPGFPGSSGWCGIKLEPIVGGGDDDGGGGGWRCRVRKLMMHLL